MQLLAAIEKLYINFFMRDLAYFFGGSFVIVSFCTAKGKDLPFLTVSELSWLRFVAFLAMAYVLGLLLSEVLILIWRLGNFIAVKVSGGGLTSPTRHISLMRTIDGQKDSEATFLRIQRLIFLKHMMATIATAFFVSSLIFLIQLAKGAANSSSLSLMFWVLLVLAILSFLDCSRLHYDEWHASATGRTDV